MDTSVREKCKNLYSEENYNKILEALEYAKSAHQGQKRLSGEDYFIHPCAVANILIDLGMDYETIIAALLHDVLEDTERTPEDIKERFGADVLTLVEGVTKLSKIKFKSKEDEQAENLRKMLLAMSCDIRIIIIKLADRLHNMRTLKYKDAAGRQRIARETLDIYAPISGRLGIGQIKGELEDLSFMYLYPDDYAEIKENVSHVMTDRQKYINVMMEEIKDKLLDIGIEGEVNGRPKHYYSIFKKMQKGKTFDQIYDLMAIRIIVNSVRDCYEVLGAIHTMWRPLPGRFKDYIAMPKKNKYQSLHTTVISPDSPAPFEVQIRTVEMHKHAEYGIAAHWKYKEGKTSHQDIDDKLAWIRQVMEMQKDINDSKEFLDSLKLDLYHDEVFVFTPKGDVINLPLGATGVDLAYAIHSAVGNKCVGIKIDSKIVPLNTELKTGNIVEVITSNASKGPSRDWLKFVKTPSARSKIRQFFKKEMRDENLIRGKEMLEKEAKHRGYNFNELINNEEWKKYIQTRYTITNLDDLYVNVGCGVFTTNQVIVRLIDLFKTNIDVKENVLEIKEQALQENVKKEVNKRQKDSGILIKGYDDFLIRLSHCCNPVPGDKIVGYISRGRGVSIHRADCPNLKNIEKSRLIEAQWPEAVNQKFNTELNIVGKNRIGLMYDVSSLLANLHVSMNSIMARLEANDMACITISVDIKNTSDIDFLIKKLKSLEGVDEVYRPQAK